jgi:hypothetical protein
MKKCDLCKDQIGIGQQSVKFALWKNYKPDILEEADRFPEDCVEVCPKCVGAAALKFENNATLVMQAVTNLSPD